MAPPVRALGSQGFKTTSQGLGCMGMTAFYKDKDHTATDEEGIAVINRALELGVTLLDTAEIYGPHTNEVLVGKAIKGKREQFQIATKFGIVWNAETGRMGSDGSRQNVRKSCEGSLQRLGIDCIDLYYMHRMDPKTPIEETMAELKALVEEGKVKYIGLSEVSAADIRKAHAVHPITAVQLEWSLWTRDAEAEVIPTCRELGIGIVAYSPLGRGFLTGKYTSLDDLDPSDFRAASPRFQALDQNLKLLAAVKALADKKGVTPGQLALAWVHNQGEDVFPIPGTKRVKYLEENVPAAEIQLSAQELRDLEAAVPPDQVQGDRYSEANGHLCHNKYVREA